LGLLLDLADSLLLWKAATGWGDGVKVVTVACPDRDDLAALLVRPDGYVAWAASTDSDPVREHAGLHRTLANWYAASV